MAILTNIFGIYSFDRMPVVECLRFDALFDGESDTIAAAKFEAKNAYKQYDAIMVVREGAENWVFKISELLSTSVETAQSCEEESLCICLPKSSVHSIHCPAHPDYSKL